MIHVFITLMMLLTVRTTSAHCTESTGLSFRLRSSSSSRQSNTEEIWDTCECAENRDLIQLPHHVDHHRSSQSDTDLSEEDIGGGEAGRHGSVVPLQRDADGAVDQLGVFGVVVLQHHGCLELLGVFAQQQACCHGRRAHGHLAEPVQQTHLTGEDDGDDFINDSTFLCFLNPACVPDLYFYRRGVKSDKGVDTELIRFWCNSTTMWGNIYREHFHPTLLDCEA